MVFYVSLFLGSLAIASIAVWLYRAIDRATHAKYRAFLPSGHEHGDPLAQTRVTRAHTRSRNGVRTPWGWKKPPRTALSGRQSMAVAATTGRAGVGWPYRDEPFESEGRTLGQHKPGSKFVSARRRDSGGVDKPWGW